MNFNDLKPQTTSNTRSAAPIHDPLSAQHKGWTVKGSIELPYHANGAPHDLTWVIGYGTEFDPENGVATNIHEARYLAEVAESYVIKRGDAHEAEDGDDVQGWDDLYEVWPAMDLMDPMDAARALIEY